MIIYNKKTISTKLQLTWRNISGHHESAQLVLSQIPDMHTRSSEHD